MPEVVRKLLALLDRRERLMALGLLALTIVNAAVQTLGIASVMPFLSVLADPETIHRNEWLSAAFTLLGFEETRGFLFFLGVVAFALIVLGNAVQAATQWATTRFVHMRQFSLSWRLMADYLRRPYTFFVTRNSSDLAKTILEETSQVITGGVMPALQLVSNSLLALAIVGFLLTVEPGLALIAAGAMSAIYGLIFLASKAWLRRIGAERVTANQERFTTVSEAFAGAKEIRLLGQERPYLQRYRQAARDFARHQANATLLGQLPQYAIEAVAVGGVFLLILYLMADGSGIAAVLPVLGVYAMAAKRLVPAFQKVFGAVAKLRFVMPAIDALLADLGEHADSLPLPQTHSGLEPLAPHREVALERVTYRYPGSSEPALHGLSLRIPANSTVGLIGSSGAGKSTLVDLLLGLLGPEDGAIRVDGVPVDSANLRRWQAGIGYVPQHIFLADDTVRGNIALGVPPAQVDEAAVERAARLANLHDFVVRELPQGYATVIGERGVRLSGGQRQRIGIARALYRDPPVLVFDEATSALDNATERAVMQAVHNLSSRKTIILIAHRLSTVKPCDQILVLSQGRIVEQGSWSELVHSGEQFHQLAAGLE